MSIGVGDGRSRESARATPRPSAPEDRASPSRPLSARARNVNAQRLPRCRLLSNALARSSSRPREPRRYTRTTPYDLEGARTHVETPPRHRPRSRLARNGGRDRDVRPSGHPIPERQHHQARRQPVRGGDRDRSARSDPRRRVLEPRVRRRDGAGDAAWTEARRGACRPSRATTGSARPAATPRCRGTRTATCSWRGSTIEDSGAIPVAISTDGGLTFDCSRCCGPNPPGVRSRWPRRGSPR